LSTHLRLRLEYNQIVIIIKIIIKFMSHVLMFNDRIKEMKVRTGLNSFEGVREKGKFYTLNSDCDLNFLREVE